MIKATAINQPEVVDELTTLFDAYEVALINNDVEALQGFFWDSSLAIRFGVTEELYGAEEISSFRQNRVINFSDRQALRKEIITLGEDFGVTTLEFSLKVFGEMRRGRQTQVWARFAEQGWRILSAHISNKVQPALPLVVDYMDRMSRMLDLPVSKQYADDVAASLQVIANVAGPLMALSLPDDLEPAPEYQP